MYYRNLAGVAAILLCVISCGVAKRDPEVNVPLRAISDVEQRDCEQQAVMAQQAAVVQTRSSSIAGQAGNAVGSRKAMRSRDDGKWAYDAAMRDCLLRLQREARNGKP